MSNKRNLMADIRVILFEDPAYVSIQLQALHKLCFQLVSNFMFGTFLF